MPNDVKVLPGEEIAITPQRKNGRRHFMRTVALINVMFMGEEIYGELVDEFSFERWPDPEFLVRMTPVLIDEEGFYIWTGNDDKGIPVYESLNFKSFTAAYIVGSTIYVSK